MLEYVKRLITPDMVSFWVPSGLNRAQDLIRGNHGQCYGTHPNVPVLPSLINPSVGWHFDASDDHVGTDFGSITTYGTTQAFWIKKDALSGTARLSNSSPLKCGFGIADFFVHTVTSSGSDNNIPKANIGVVAGTWHFLAITREALNDNEVKVYLDAELKETGNLVNAVNGFMTLATAPYLLGYSSDAFDGYVALPFAANAAWSVAQVKNFHNATKGMFAPRG